MKMNPIVISKSIDVHLLTLSMLIMSFYNIYSASLGVPIAGILGSFLLFMTAVVITTKTTPFARSIIFLILILICIVSILSAIWGILAFSNVSTKGLAGVLLGCIIYLISVSFPNLKERYLQALDIVLTIHLILWVTQLAYYLFTQKYLDYLNIIFGMQSRYLFSTYGFNITRFTGFFSEPAIFGTFIAMGLSVRLAASQFKIRTKDILLICAVISTLSLFSYFLLFVIAFGAFFYLSKRTQLILSFILLGLIILVAFFTWHYAGGYFITRLSNPLHDPSGAVRLIDGFKYISTLPEIRQLFGEGLGNYSM